MDGGADGSMEQYELRCEAGAHAGSLENTGSCGLEPKREDDGEYLSEMHDNPG